MEYGKRAHYDEAAQRLKEGSWIADPDTGLIWGRGRSLSQWRVIGSEREGYVRLSLGYKRPAVSAHRVIWEFVHGPSDLSFTINHRNGVGSDNRICNLELATNAQNVQHAYNNGLIRLRDARGSRNNLAKLTDDQVRLIRFRRQQGEKLQSLAAEFGVSMQNICNIAKGRTWQHLEAS